MAGLLFTASRTTFIDDGVIPATECRFAAVIDVMHDDDGNDDDNDNDNDDDVDNDEDDGDGDGGANILQSTSHSFLLSMPSDENELQTLRISRILYTGLYAVVVIKLFDEIFSMALTSSSSSSCD